MDHPRLLSYNTLSRSWTEWRTNVGTSPVGSSSVHGRDRCEPGVAMISLGPLLVVWLVGHLFARVGIGFFCFFFFFENCHLRGVFLFFFVPGDLF